MKNNKRYTGEFKKQRVALYTNAKSGPGWKNIMEQPKQQIEQQSPIL